ncbi:MAG TPA: carboxy terminal-processing peptidase [Flavobacteriaceae bacterium]|nr:carboxy terminal-processing peptidase [Flavobacteriaceae bacterium]
MKRNYHILLLGLLLAFASCSFTTKTFSDPDKDKLLIQIVTYVLEKLHFDPKEVDDTFSEEVFTAYLENLDPLKRYFYKSDIEEFEMYKTQIDDQLKETDISFFNLTHQRLVQRIEESKLLYQSVLAIPFDFSREEEINVDYENVDYVTNSKEMRERWRKQLKYATIGSYYDLISENQDDTASAETLAKLEEEARMETKRSVDMYFDDVDDLIRKDWFAVYINAIVLNYDPHTLYFAPEVKDRFDQQMSGKLEGIGARLQKRMDDTKIVELISGGPAWRGQELEVGDIITKVRQEDEEQPVNIVGMRLDEAIKLIKGPKGTKVILTVKKVDGTIKDITITRDLVELEETYAKSSIVDKNNKRFGIIDLPSFYADFNDYSSKNAATDVKIEIERLKEQNIEGLVLDLRNNGGGSLQTVVEIAGLFIKDGPIVQVKSTGQPQDVLKDKDKSIVWDGPLVILVNELSASASEILAAAMQDYKRAIIIGGKQTYGKGTVQRVFDLNQAVRGNTEGDLGALKLTTQKFYRVNGGSTQLEGVKSDVVVPDRYSYIDIGEKDQENPLPWDKIDAVDYVIWDSYFDYENTIKKSKQRMSDNEQLVLIEENAKWIKKNMDVTSIPLDYQSYKERIERNEMEAQRFDKLSEYSSNLTFNSLPYEQRLFEQDTILKEKRVRWHENLSKDVYVEEALNVLEDLKMTYTIKKVAAIKD